MAEISVLMRLLNGLPRSIDLASNTLVANEVKVGGASGTLLTKTILDNLVSLQNGSDIADTLHHHDGRYYTESELGSTTNGSSGASLIGVDQTPAFTNFSGANVQAALEAIDSALTSALSTEFADNVFRVIGSADATKKLAFEVDGLTTATVRTLTIQDKNIIVAGTANETHTGTTVIQDILRIDGQSHSPINDKGNVTGAVTIDWDNGNIQHLTMTGNVTLTFQNGRDGGQYLLVADQDGVGGHTLTFPSGVAQGVQFLGPAPVVASGANERSTFTFFLDDAKATNKFQGFANNEITSMANGGTGANLSPVAGAVVWTDADSMEVSAAGSAGQVLISGGTSAPSWLTLAGGNGISYSSGTFDIDLASNPGLEFNTAQLQVKVDAAGAINRGASGIGVNVDNSSIEIATNALQVKADGIDQTHIQLDNNSFLQALNASAVSTNVIALNASNEIVFGSLPKDATVPTDNAHLVNKLYVDTQITAAAAGLDPKESVRVASTADVGGTYNGAASPDEITGLAALAIDGVTLAQGNRVLLKNQTDAKQNGIFTYDLANTKLVRASDQDGSPANEVSGGNFTFVEQGTVNMNSGWVLQGNGVLTLDIDNLVWVQFSGGGAFTGGNGIDITGTTISVDLSAASGLQFNVGELELDLLSAGGLKLVGNELSVEPADFAGNGLEDDGSDNLKLAFDTLTAAALETGDALAFHDANEGTAATDHKKITIDNLVSTLAGNGIAANGIALDLDINGLAASATSLESTDLLAIYDNSAAANVKISIANILGAGLDLTAGKIAVQLGTGLEMDSASDVKLAYNTLTAASLAAADEISFFDASEASPNIDHKKITYDNLVTGLAGDGLQNIGSQLAIDASVIAGLGLEDDGAENLKLAIDTLAVETVIDTADSLVFFDASAAAANDHKKILMSSLLAQLAGAGLASSAGALAINTGDGVKIDSDTVKLDINGLAAETVIADGDELVFYDISGSVHKKITKANLIGDTATLSESMVAGEAFAANTSFLVRMAMSGETAGRVYKADFDASSSDKFYVIGIALSTSAVTAGQNITVIKIGQHVLGSLDADFTASSDEGKPVYLGASGAFTLTAPSSANQAVFRVGTVRNVGVSSAIEMGGYQLNGIN